MPKKVINELEKAVRSRRQSNEEIMEIMVYVDKQTVDFYGAGTENYVHNVLNVVSINKYEIYMYIIFKMFCISYIFQY